MFEPLNVPVEQLVQPVLRPPKTKPNRESRSQTKGCGEDPVMDSTAIEPTVSNTNRLSRQACKVFATTTKRIAVFGMTATFAILASADAWASRAEAVRTIRKHTESIDKLSYVVYRGR